MIHVPGTWYECILYETFPVTPMDSQRENNMALGTIAEPNFVFVLLQNEQNFLHRLHVRGTVYTLLLCTWYNMYLWARFVRTYSSLPAVGCLLYYVPGINVYQVSRSAVVLRWLSHPRLISEAAAL